MKNSIVYSKNLKKIEKHLSIFQHAGYQELTSHNNEG